MSPVRTATPEHKGNWNLPRPSSTPVDLLFATENVALSEIVVDWQLPADMERDRR